ncbi:hypothetical protein [Streptomyces sediminimaris]|uniref:hypothetical protein n=1 Tax=Streptomyces sediminimaris TaxID=3383721 RepID=UPI003999CFF5
MTDMNDLMVDDVDYWLDCLPRYQLSSVQIMLESGKSFEEVAAAWMSGSVAGTTAPFSSGLGPKIFFEHFMDQMHDLLCTGNRYEEERAGIMAGFKPKQTGLAATISAAIAPHLGAAPAIIAPATALILCAVSKMGLGAWCAMQTQRRSNSPDGTPTQQPGPLPEPPPGTDEQS